MMTEVQIMSFLHAWWENISISKVLASINSYLPLVLLPCVHVFLFNIGCIGSCVTSLLSTHITMMSKTFYFKMVDDVIGVFLGKCYENQASLP